MGIDIALKKAGIETYRDVPKPGQRRAKDFALIIGTARKLEAEDAQMDRERNRKVEELSMRVCDLTQENAELRAQNAALLLRERLREIEVSREDSRYLLTGEKVA